MARGSAPAKRRSVEQVCWQRALLDQALAGRALLDSALAKRESVERGRWQRALFDQSPAGWAPLGRLLLWIVHLEPLSAGLPSLDWTPRWSLAPNHPGVNRRKRRRSRWCRQGERVKVGLSSLFFRILCCGQ